MAPGIVDTPLDDFSDRHMWSRARDGASAIVRNDEVVEEDGYLTFRFADEATSFIRDHADDPYRRTYAAMTATLDDAVGQILRTLDEEGIAEEAIVIFTSDNGGTSYLGVTDNGPRAGGMAVPFLMRYPERSRSPGRRASLWTE